MSLRIDRAFIDTVDLYKPVARTKDANGFSTGEDTFGAVTYANVQCRFDGRKEISDALPMGRSNVMNMDTADQLRVLDSQTLQDGWYAQLKTVGHPLYGMWFVVQGDGQPRHWRAGIKVHILKRATKPPGVA